MSVCLAGQDSAVRMFRVLVHRRLIRNGRSPCNLLRHHQNGGLDSSKSVEHFSNTEILDYSKIKTYFFTKISASGAREQNWQKCHVITHNLVRAIRWTYLF